MTVTVPVSITFPAANSQSMITVNIYMRLDNTPHRLTQPYRYTSVAGIEAAFSTNASVPVVVVPRMLSFCIVLFLASLVSEVPTVDGLPALPNAPSC